MRWVGEGRGCAASPSGAAHVEKSPLRCERRELVLVLDLLGVVGSATFSQALIVLGDNVVRPLRRGRDGVGTSAGGLAAAQVLVVAVLAVAGIGRRPTRLGCVVPGGLHLVEALGIVAEDKEVSAESVRGARVGREVRAGRRHVRVAGSLRLDVPLHEVLAYPAFSLFPQVELVRVRQGP
jgi:hypothetical protein